MRWKIIFHKRTCRAVKRNQVINNSRTFQAPPHFIKKRTSITSIKQVLTIFAYAVNKGIFRSVVSFKLIIDEIGYLPVDEAAAFGFFQLIAARYEYRPLKCFLFELIQTFSDLI